MEAMTRETVNPLQMPKGLTPSEQQWWVTTAALIVELQARSVGLRRAALRATKQAQAARDDFGRLREEYRARWFGRKPEWAVDIMFKGLAVAQECMTDDAWWSRQATEQAAAANTCDTRVVTLMDEMRALLRQKIQHRLAAQQRHPGQVPAPREGS